MTELDQISSSALMGRSTGNDIKLIQQKINKSELELSQLRNELERTRQQAKQAEQQAQESGRTNRKLKAEIQALTDMSNRKDRQAENAKATAFFFESQYKKYTDEIESAQQGMGHLKELDEERTAAIEQHKELERTAQEEYEQVRLEIKEAKAHYAEKKEKLVSDIKEAYQELIHVTDRVQRLQEELEARIANGASQFSLERVEQEYEAVQQEQRSMVLDVEKSLKDLQKRLETSEQSTTKHEDVMVMVKTEMDRIMRRIRIIDQAELQN